jgi:hypothetical protein
MSYGYTVEREKKDPLLAVIDTAADEFYIATSPGSWLVDTFPICQCLLLFLHDNYIRIDSPKYAISQRGCQVADLRR